MRLENSGKVPAISDEAELLLACVRAAIAGTEPSAVRARIARVSPDWDRLVRMSIAHGVMPLVYRALNDSSCPGVPAKALAELRINYRANLYHSARKVGELKHLLNLFGTSQIQVLGLKGPVLAFMAYGDVAMRQYTDLDLLVRRSEVPRAADLLISAGYLPRTYDREAFSTNFFRNTSDEFLPSGNRSVVDLHWKLLAWYFPFGPEEEGVWSRSEAIWLEGQPVRTLAPADHLHVQCVHSCKHGWPTLASVAEIAALLRSKPQIQLRNLVEDAASVHAERMIQLGLYLAYRLAGTSLPDDQLERILGNSKLTALGERIVARMFARPQPSGTGSLSSWRFSLATIERPRDRVRYFVNLGLPTGSDHSLLRLPLKLYPLYYLLRPVRIAFRICSSRWGTSSSLPTGQQQRD